MRFIIKLAIEDESGTETLEEIIQFDKSCGDNKVVGISLNESNQLLKILQSKIIFQQAKKHIEYKRTCSSCHKKQNVKGYHSIQYRTLFGIVNLQSPRLYRCQCNDPHTKTFSPLSEWLPDKNSPDLQYIETKWASLISFQQTAHIFMLSLMVVCITDSP